MIRWNSIHPECQIKEREIRVNDPKLRDEYKKMQKYYVYVRRQKYLGTLSKEQILRCKEGNIRGPFGYPERTKKIAREYGIDTELVDDIFSVWHFNSINEYTELMIKDGVDCNNMRRYYDVNLNSDLGLEYFLRSIIPVSKNGYEKKYLGYGIYDKEIVLEKLKELLINEKQRKVIFEVYGIDGNLPKSTEEVSEEMGVSRTTINNYRNDAIDIIMKNIKEIGITFIPDFKNIKEDERQKIVELLGNYVFFGRRDFISDGEKYNIDNLYELLQVCEEIEKYGELGKNEEQKEIYGIQSDIDEVKEQILFYNMPIENLKLDSRIYNILVENGVKYIKDIIRLDNMGRLTNLGNLGKLGIRSIKREIERYRNIVNNYNEINPNDCIEENIRISVTRNFSNREEELRRLEEESRLKAQNGAIRDSGNVESEEARILEEKTNEVSELELLKARKRKLLEELKQIKIRINGARGNLQNNIHHVSNVEQNEIDM